MAQHARRSPFQLLTHPAVSSGLVALIFTVLLYSRALALPLFSDDLVQIPWLESISWRELWTSPSPYGYYRPLWYTLWRVWRSVAGGLRPAGLHFINLAAHFAAAWTAGLLAAAWVSRPTGPTWAAGPAAAIFATFPFARQAIAWPGAVYNPLVSAMAAGALLAYDRGRRTGRARWGALAMLLAALAPFTYEAGMLVGGMVILSEIIGRLSGRWERRSRQPLAFGGMLIAAFAIWRAMRGAGVTSFGLTPADLRRNVGYLAQGLIYPTAPLGQRLAERLDLPSELCLWSVAIPTLALLVWSGLRWNRAALCLGGAWFLLFALPPLVSMEADWFALAPRFLYMTAAGGAMVWSAALGGWLSHLCPRWRLPVVAAMLVALLTPAAGFIQDGLRLYAMAGESIWDAAAAARRDRPVLLVNLPMQIEPRARLYPLGFEGVTPLPQRVTAQGLAYVHTGLRNAAEAVAFGIVKTSEPPTYSYQLHGRPAGWEEMAAAIRRSRAVYLTQYESERIYLREAGGLFRQPPETRFVATFNEQIALLHVAATCDESGQVQLVAWWQVKSKVEADATVFAHLLAQNGALVAQADGYPLLEMFPFRFWEAGEAARDVRYFPPVTSGTYTIRLGVWNLANGERWPASGYADGVVLTQVQCP